MSIRLDGGPALVTGDQALLRRAVHNLVENAVKYGRDGGRISIRIRPSGLDVENEGSGIDSAHLGRLFDRFYRVDPARSNLTPGSGLGLALVKSIIEAHGGGVSVQSADGVTLFRIDFQEASIVKRERSRD
jgi:two-component system, OmpR family, heavy metal sensor histidine kinase CusS